LHDAACAEEQADRVNNKTASPATGILKKLYIKRMVYNLQQSVTCVKYNSSEQSWLVYA
jgi:hypothetical protein